jgi:hypothetical protein
MATLTVTLSGSAIVNGSKSFTINDADITSLINWAIGRYSPPPPAPPLTQAQALTAWVQSWANATRDSVQQFGTPAPVPPAPIVFT